MRNPTETDLSPSESRNLRCIAGVMVPAGEEFGVPGADDALIFADIIASLGRDIGAVRDALAELSALADGSFADLDEARQESVAEEFLRGGGSAAAAILGRVILQCYYRDDRVVRSLGLEPGPPFPKGRTLEQGDWSLLDPVRDRPRMWRDLA
jgi:hypothetical protein